MGRNPDLAVVELEKASWRSQQGQEWKHDLPLSVLVVQLSLYLTAHP